jgi:hypothetical protein
MLVGLTGLKGSGKDTVADYLVKHHGYEKVSFAALLKESVASLFDIQREYIEEWKNDPHVSVAIRITELDQTPPLSITAIEMSFREFLQRYGTEAHREVFGQDFWVEQAFMSFPFTVRDNLVFPDVRFDNEAIAIIVRDGLVFSVERPGSDLEDQHASEQGINPEWIADFLHNDGDFENLYDQIEERIIEREG